MSGIRFKLFFGSICRDRGPKLLFAVGWCLFWLAGSRGERAPLVALLVGPVVMFTAILLLKSPSKAAGPPRRLDDARGPAPPPPAPATQNPGAEKAVTA